MKKSIFVMGLIMLLATASVAQASLYQLYDSSFNPTATVSALNFSNSITGAGFDTKTFYFSVLGAPNALPQSVTLGQAYTFSGQGMPWSAQYTLSQTTILAGGGGFGFGAGGASGVASTGISTNTIYGLMIQNMASGFLAQSSLSVELRASAPATTPLPAAVWLLGSGLMGLVGLRKKFQA